MGNIKTSIWVCCFLVTVLCTFQTFAQVTGKYARGKVVLKTGVIIEGKNLVLSPTDVTMDVSGVTQVYELSEVNQVMSRGNKGQTGCLIGAGGCAALGILAYLVADDESFQNAYGDDDPTKTKSDYTGQYFLGLALWSGCFGGLGYLIGKSSDKWEIVYVRTEGTGLNEYWKPQLQDYLSPTLVLGRYIEEAESGRLIVTN